MKKVLSFVTGALFNISVIAFAGTLLFQTLSQNGMIQQNVLYPLLGALLLKPSILENNRLDLKLGILQ